MNEITISKTPVSVKEYRGNRVVTFKDIDMVHGRSSGMARKRFNDNKIHFIEGEDYFKVCASEIRTHKIMELSPKSHGDVILLTECGYLMIVKSFTDTLSWDIQRELVKCYFKKETPKKYANEYVDIKNSPELKEIISKARKTMDALETMLTMLESSRRGVNEFCRITTGIVEIAWELYRSINKLPLYTFKTKEERS